MIHAFACIAFWLTISAFFVAAATATVTSPIVDLGYAQYQGRFDAQANITSFLGIRYAAPPTGSSRFQAPQTPTPQSGVQSATANPNMCYQGAFGTSSTTVVASEDCLFLNVFVSGTIPAEKNSTGGLPVLVWIHGGGFQIGSAAEYNGADLVANSLGSVVVVVIQYRLGAFGFLSGNEVKAQGALNAGLLDQRFALQWVQDHIGLFGGDRTHVTIWGESAGAGSVVQHIVADGGNTQPPLFVGAITSSTALSSQYNYNDRIPQLVYNEFVFKTGCASSFNTLACLQSVEVETLQAAHTDIATSASYGMVVFVPVVDGTFIVERPTITLARGQVNGEFLLAVSNQNEGSMFVNPNETLTIAEYISELFPHMTPCAMREAEAVYQAYGSALEQIILALGDSTFTCPTYYLLETFAGRSWKGLFAIPPAYHGQDLPYYFYNAGAPPPYNNTQFITTFSQSFMSFAKHYDVNVKFDPTDNITPEWDTYLGFPGLSRSEMLFNRTAEGEPVVTPVVTDPKLIERCRFWWSVTPMTAQ